MGGGDSRVVDRADPAVVSPHRRPRGREIVDSHAHLESCDAEPSELIAEARDAGVERIVTIGMGRASAQSAVALTRVHPEVYAAIGVHPHDASGFTVADVDWMTALAREEKVVAIGECGLDYHYDHSPRDQQAAAFVAQIAVARDVGLPLVVHTRDAAVDTLALLDEHAAGHPVVLHCFSLPEHLDEVVRRGYWLSFAGPVTFRRNHELQRAAAQAPLGRMLVETDSPYLAPVPRRGRPNRPANVAHTLRFIAELRDVPAAELDAITSENAARVFGW